MKHFKSSSIIFLLLVFLFSDCSSAQKLQKIVPIKYEGVCYQKWAAGIKEGGSGINLFIPASGELPKNVQLCSVYFRGKVAILERLDVETLLFVGRFKTEFSQKSVGNMATSSYESDDNQTLILQEKFPFELKDSECVVSYKEGKETKYFKIQNVIEKLAQNYPSAPNKK